MANRNHSNGILKSSFIVQNKEIKSFADATPTDIYDTFLPYSIPIIAHDIDVLLNIKIQKQDSLPVISRIAQYIA